MEEEEILINPLDNLEGEEELIQTPTPEKEEDNSKAPEDKLPEEKKELTAKEIRHQQQEEGRLAEVQRLRNLVIESEVEKASKDATSLLNLAQKDPKLADEVARKFGYDDFKEAKKEITAGESVEDKKPIVMTEDDLEEWYQKRSAKAEHEAALVEAQSLISELPEDAQDEAIELFNEMIEGKLLTKDKALKFAKMVTLSLKKEEVSTKKIDKAEGLKKLSSVGLNQSKKVSKDEPQLVIFGGEEILLDSNKQL